MHCICAWKEIKIFRTGLLRFRTRSHFGSLCFARDAAWNIILTYWLTLFDLRPVYTLAYTVLISRHITKNAMSVGNWL